MWKKAKAKAAAAKEAASKKAAEAKLKIEEAKKAREAKKAKEAEEKAQAEEAAKKEAEEQAKNAPVSTEENAPASTEEKEPTTTTENDDGAIKREDTMSKWGKNLKTFTNKAVEATSKKANELQQQYDDYNIAKVDSKRKDKISGFEKDSIFGQYTIFTEDELKKEQQEKIKKIEMEQAALLNEDINDNNKNMNTHPLIPLKEDELLNFNVSTFRSHLGAQGWESNHMEHVSFNDDIIVSNDFCQIAVGNGIYTKEDMVKFLEEQQKEKAEKEVFIVKKTDKEEKKDDDDDDKKDDKKEEQDDADMQEALAVVQQQNYGNNQPMMKIEKNKFAIPDKKIDGELNEQFKDFKPDKAFTICLETKAKTVDRWNIVLTTHNGNKKGKGFAIVAPRVGSSRIAVQLGSEFKNVGKTQLYPNMWYHIAVVFKHISVETNTPRDRLTTEVSVYLNGVFDGKISVEGHAAFIGGKKGATIGPKPFAGEVKNIEIFYKELSKDDIKKLANRPTNLSFRRPVLLSYDPTSLKVEIPVHLEKYNGPIKMELKDWKYQPGLESFTITAWICCTRAISPLGSIICSNFKSNGFELICPSDQGVIGINATGLSRKQQMDNSYGVSLGTTKIEMNQEYHIAITVGRVITTGDRADQTVFACYINGKQDGSYNLPDTYSYSGGKWNIGWNPSKKEDSKFDGSINNLRIFKRPLLASEVACVYAGDRRERMFKVNDKILYYSKKKKEFISGKLLEFNVSDATAKIADDESSEECSLSLSEVTIGLDRISRFVPGSDTKYVAGLGGMIHGADYNGKKWKIFSGETDFLRHIVTPSCFVLLQNGLPFPKHIFQAIIDNKHIDNKYIINRLLYSTHELMKNINKNKSVWAYFNEYILPWNVWKEGKAFTQLQAVARNLQTKYKNMQLNLYIDLKKEKWDMFDIPHSSHETIKNRHDAEFEYSMTTEIDSSLVGKENATMYDSVVSTHLVWGRCMMLNESFQKRMGQIFADLEISHPPGPNWNSPVNEKGEKMNRFNFEAGPPKTHERMIEKSSKYQGKNCKFPAAYEICDVLRCSIICQDLNDTALAYKALTEGIQVIRVKNRFLEDFNAEKETDGYRDMLCNVLFINHDLKLSAVCEVQFHLQGYVHIKHKQHKYYKIVRASDYMTLLRNWEARKFDDKKKKDKKKQH